MTRAEIKAEYTKNNEPFEKFPIEVQEDIKSVCRVYDKAFVTYEYGKYHVSAGIGITATYAPDHRMCGTYYAEDIFTQDERTLNYVNNFYDYPCWYKGKKDYKIFHTGKRETFKLVDGDIEIA